jgi:membrane-associated protein
MGILTDFLAWITGLIDSLAALVTDSPLTYVVIMGMAAIDVLAPIVPAEATVTAAAVLAGQGKLNVIWIMIAAGLGAFIGDNVAYWIGRAAGRPLVERVMRGHTAQLEGVAGQFERRGGLFIIIGRFVPGGRTAVAIGAGVLRFSWPRFLLYDALAAVIWAFQAALPGFIGTWSRLLGQPATRRTGVADPAGPPTRSRRPPSAAAIHSRGRMRPAGSVSSPGSETRLAMTMAMPMPIQATAEAHSRL